VRVRSLCRLRLRCVHINCRFSLRPSHKGIQDSQSGEQFTCTQRSLTIQIQYVHCHKHMQDNTGHTDEKYTPCARTVGHSHRHPQILSPTSTLTHQRKHKHTHTNTNTHTHTHTHTTHTQHTNTHPQDHTHKHTHKHTHTSIHTNKYTSHT